MNSYRALDSPYQKFYDKMNSVKKTKKSVLNTNFHSGWIQGPLWATMLRFFVGLNNEHAGLVCTFCSLLLTSTVKFLEARVYDWAEDEEEEKVGDQEVIGGSENPNPEVRAKIHIIHILIFYHILWMKSALSITVYGFHETKFWKISDYAKFSRNFA